MYINARENAKVKNLGKDIEGSARHIRGGKRSIEQMELDGTAEKEIVRSKILKNNLPENIEISQKNAIIRLFLNGLPTKPSKPRNTSLSAQIRKCYYDSIISFIELANKLEEEISNTETTQRTFDIVRKEMRNHAKSRIYKLREVRENSIEGDNLVSFHNTKCGGSYHKTSVAKAISTLQKETESMSESEKEEVYRNIIEKNMTVFKALGKKKDVKKRFNRSSMYGKSSKRVGNDHAISDYPNFLMKDANIQAIQFGNYVSDKERADHLEHISNALMDFSEISGLSVSKLSRGKLSIAVGARGSGKALAHYEPTFNIINLTKNNGFGSLSHEMGHFYDIEFARARGLGHDYASNTRLVHLKEKLSKSEYEIFLKWNQALDKIRKRILSCDTCRMLMEKKVGYWTSGLEIFARAFEVYCHGKLEENGHKNDYFVCGIKSPLMPTKEEIKDLGEFFQLILNP